MSRFFGFVNARLTTGPVLALIQVAAIVERLFPGLCSCLCVCGDTGAGAGAGAGADDSVDVDALLCEPCMVALYCGRSP